MQYKLALDESKLREFYYEPHEFRGHRLYRRVFIMEKSGILGKIADYKLLDFIVVDLTPEELLPLIKPIPDVMVERFLLPGQGKIIKKSFWFGLRGWAYIGFLEGKEKLFDDMRSEVKQALKP
ncbi:MULTISPECIES: hypothetical protein [Thermoanaerobacter]|uniref:Uncharacterized protein n=2 Tax=Thermoanaerobacter TaxID=1754 RepID=I8R4B2_9THEO|nr:MULTISPECIES: hypothetical protein [Thermoanaerobacter]AEM77562.1 hypothetical protein Thewi_0049 [Thermoanaerobacter wiegelii Rt8.B1]EIW00260.1 hypothetical protein ThesiDRAFT1_1308 [Thermoanaerobacter siderophilus SR4]